MLDENGHGCDIRSPDLRVSMIVLAALCATAVVIMPPAMALSDDYVSMPDGFRYHKSCVHHHGKGLTFAAERLPGGFTRVVGDNGKTDLLPECPYERVPTSKPTNPANPESYYSDWSVYAQTAGPKFNFMTSEWVVPPAPKSRGPLGLSSVYLFNGLEDGGGVHGAASLILQPVLLFGKSGCLLNPASWGQWHIGSYLVDGNGRAHCGKHIPVSPNQTIIGTMTEQGNNTWSVEAIAVGQDGKENQTSSYVGKLGDKHINAAYLTLEGMVIYNCATYPPSNGITFKNVVLGTETGGIEKKNSWTGEIRHSECGQQAKVESADGRVVALLWEAS